MGKRRSKDEPYLNPFEIYCDNNEGLPYTFQGIPADSSHQNEAGNRLIEVPTIKISLPEGDYGVKGMERLVCVERKTASDLYMCLGSERDRFEALIKRMASYRTACVVVEATMEDLLLSPPKWSELNPRIVYRTILSWTERYGVPFFTVGGSRVGDRRLGELTTFRFLEKAWEHRNERRIPKPTWPMRVSGEPRSVD
jgi:hypothetical protein